MTSNHHNPKTGRITTSSTTYLEHMIPRSTKMQPRQRIRGPNIMSLGYCALILSAMISASAFLRPSSFLSGAATQGTIRRRWATSTCNNNNHALVTMSAVGGDRGNSKDNRSISNEKPPAPVADFVADANKAIVKTIKDSLFAIYGERHYARFYALETIARVPYFAYTSVLHLYETLGWRRRADLMKIHFAESWNELHHLLIMEDLGGNKDWGDRLIAVHLAFFYYWIAIGLYMTSPEIAYNLNEQVERHAYDTYDKFLKSHETELKALPAPSVAKEYYQTGDLYMFDEFHTNTPHERRRPKIENLYDVFVNIRNDEREHFLTMEAMQQSASNIVSPNTVDPRSSNSVSSSASSASWSVSVKQKGRQEEE